MAKRSVLHISKLEDLKEWLVEDGWELLPLSNNPYEVLRASKAGKQNPLIIYSRKSSEYLSFADRDMPVIGAFLREERGVFGKWIPVSERLPEDDKYIMLSFDNFTLPNIGRYEVDKDGNGAFYPGDDDKSYVAYGLFVNAWMPLPEQYRMEENNGR